MGQAGRDLGTPRPLERTLGELLFDRYPHLVPSPVQMASLDSLVAGLRGGDARGRYAAVRPLVVLQVWFDCWATLALRTPPCPCDGSQAHS